MVAGDQIAAAVGPGNRNSRSVVAADQITSVGAVRAISAADLVVGRSLQMDATGAVGQGRQTIQSRASEVAVYKVGIAILDHDAETEVARD